MTNTRSVRMRFVKKEMRVAFHFKDDKDQVLFEEHQKDWQGAHSTLKDKDGKVLATYRNNVGLGFSPILRTVPSFPDQQPLQLPQNESKKGEEKVAPDLFLFARLTVNSETGHVILSYCKCLDEEHKSCYRWKNLCKGVRIPQFQYAVVVLDLQQQQGNTSNIVLKSKQRVPSIQFRPLKLRLPPIR
jgi:hypothetical protein